MLELPEVLTMKRQLIEKVRQKTVSRILPPTKHHKFCWYQGDPCDYDKAVKGHQIVSANGFGIFVELSFDHGYRLCFNDGVNVRLMPVDEVPKAYQLVIEFMDKTALVFTVAMYGSIILHRGEYDNVYYEKSRKAVLPFAPEFAEYYHKQLEQVKQTISVKAFLATEQRFPGIGNGVLQDILFEAKIHPKRKLETLDKVDRECLQNSVISVLREMTDCGGRDTEKDLYGNPGGYITKMSKNSYHGTCPVCGGIIRKETFLGGTVYYCEICQPY